MQATPGKKYSILLVDDDQLTREIFTDKFGSEGFEVFEANDGLEGLNLAQEKKPSVIFTGIMMPRMTGFDMMRQIKENALLNTIPVLVFSHLGREEDRKQAHELGAKEFLVKGITTPNEVFHKILDMLQGRQFKISFNPLEMDAPVLMKENKCLSPTPKLELRPLEGGGPGTYKATFLCE